MHYFTFHIGDWLKSTSHLTAIEISIYLRLVLHYYETEQPISLETAQVARKLRLSKSLKILDAILVEFFTKTPEGWKHPRCEKELAEIYEKSDQAREAARIRWEAKRNADAMRAHNGSNPDGMLPNTHNPIPTNPEPRVVSAKAQKQPLDYSCWPSEPEPGVLADWLAMRKRMKADVSQTVINQFAPQLREAGRNGYSVTYCLSECITSNWRGFKFSWLKNQEASNAKNQRPNYQSRGERNEQAFRDYLANIPQDGPDSGMLAALIGPTTGK